MSSFCTILLYNSWQQCHVISPPPYPLINRTLTPSFHSTSDWSAETGSVWLHQSIGGLQRGRWCHLMLLTHRSHEISLQQTPSLPEIPSWDSVCVCLCCGDIIGNLSWCQTTFLRNDFSLQKQRNPGKSKFLHACKCTCTNMRISY